MVIFERLGMNNPPRSNNYQIGVFDHNGTLRGKWFPENKLVKILKSGIRMPGSILACDIWGQDRVTNEYVRMEGDSDLVCMPTGREILPLPWLENNSHLIHGWMLDENGSIFSGDPRGELHTIVQKFHARGMYPVVAFEIEFYLIEKELNQPQPIYLEAQKKRLDKDSILSLDELDCLREFFQEIESIALDQGIVTAGISSENGPSQYEINLEHTKDPLKAADDTHLMKRLIKGVASKHEFKATFMAKPYPEYAGSSMHVHVSIVDNKGQNIFNEDLPDGSQCLRHGIGGLLDQFDESLLLFAPHLNSYRRFLPGLLAPVKASWGQENRTTAIRIPGGPTNSRRIEHRLAGSDTNPYLVLAAVLGGILNGLEKKIDPGEPVKGFAPQEKLKPNPPNWGSAIAQFAHSSKMAEIFSDRFIDMYITTKNYEYGEFAKKISPVEYEAYLDAC